MANHIHHIAKPKILWPYVPREEDSPSEDVNHQLLSLTKRPPSLCLGDLPCYISFPLVHPPPTLVSHPCPYLSARPIDHSFWRSVSGCGPECTVQESHPHKWGQGISWRYLIQRWQLLLGLLFYYAPMVGPLDSELLLGCLKGLPLATWRFPLLWFWFAKDRVVLGNISWQSGFPLFVLKHFFLFGMGLGPDMK